MNTKTTVLTENDGDPAALEELVIVEDAPAGKAEAADEDDRDDDEPARKVESAADANEDEREAIRERRRLEKLERKERREKAITRDKIELEFLRKRNDELERRMSAQELRAHQQDLNGVDARIRQAMQEAQMAETVIAKAVAAGNGEDVTKAMRYRDEALARANQLNAYKQQQAQRPAVVTPEPQVDSAVVEHAKDFMEEHPWYDVQGRDEDSAVVLAIDSALVRDGYDPKSDEYWAELRKRVARRFPDKVGGAGARAPRGGPSIGSGREHAPASTRREVYISPERKQALIDAGVWDDPVLRMKYVKRYAEYDRANKA